MQNLETKLEFFSRVGRYHAQLNLDKKPFDANDDLIEQTWQLTKEYPIKSIERAQSIYYWILKNWTYDRPMIEGKYYSASETFNMKRGVCREAAFLYTTMARIAGFESNYVFVERSCKGDTAPHACSNIIIGDNKILVDPSYPFIYPDCEGFDIKHGPTIEYNDNRIIEEYNQHSLQRNNNINCLNRNQCSPRRNKDNNGLFIGFVALCILLGSGYSKLSEGNTLSNLQSTYYNAVNTINSAMTFNIKKTKEYNICKKLNILEYERMSNKRKKKIYNRMLKDLKEVTPYDYELKTYHFPGDYNLVKVKYNKSKKSFCNLP